MYVQVYPRLHVFTIKIYFSVLMVVTVNIGSISLNADMIVKSFST